MRKIDRSLASKPGPLANTRERDKFRKYYSDPAANEKRPKFLVYRDPAIKQALEALFNGKCAYCETMYAPSTPVDVEHFRPKGAPAEDSTHPGYWWLASDWENLLPSCNDCNRRREQIIVDASASLIDLCRSRRPAQGSVAAQSGKGRCFPVDGTRALPEEQNFALEVAQLLNPCEDLPSDHIDFSILGDDGVCLAVPAGGNNPSLRGAVTIQAFGLNRLALVQERTRLIRRLQFMRDIVLELDEVLRGLSEPDARSALRGTSAEGAEEVIRKVIGRTLEEMISAADPSQPYSAAASAWLRDFATDLDI